MSERDVDGLEQRVLAGEARVSSPHDGAVFWSGDRHGASKYPHNRWRAEEFCRQGNSAGEIYRVTLERTADGKGLDEFFAAAAREGRTKSPGDISELKPRLDRLATALSCKYAESASGKVNTFCVGSGPGSYFRREELPRLLANPRVESINGVEKHRLRVLYETGPDGREACFNRICQAELARDRAWASTIGEAKGPADYKDREETFARQLREQGRTPQTAVAVRDRQTEVAATGAGVVAGAAVARNAEREHMAGGAGTQASAAASPRSQTGKAWAEVQARKAQESAAESRGHEVSQSPSTGSRKPSEELQRSR